MDDPFVCPTMKLPLRAVALADAEATVGPLRGRDGSAPPPGVRMVLLRSDGKRAYPIANGIPRLLAPEALGPIEEPVVVDLADPRYAEAYTEMAHYDQLADEEARNVVPSSAGVALRPILEASPRDRARFPDPRDVWLDQVYDCASQRDAYAHLAPLEGTRVLQLGGNGLHAVKFLLAGAREAWVASPMSGELRWAAAIARLAGVEDRLRLAGCVAEELPFADGIFDRVHSGACVHHMVTRIALPEIARVLGPGGRFSAVDPWKAPLYSIGIKIFGKRENVPCRPLTVERVAPLRDSFPSAEIVQHGALFRYVLLAMLKMGITSSLRVAWNVNRIDDGISGMLGLRRFGSSVALLGAKP